MLASRLPGILPPLSEQEAQQTAAIHSIGGLTPRAGHWHHGHTARRTTVPRQWRWWAVAATRGPAKYRWPTTGCCFSTKPPEFERKVLDSLREPLETGHITISRAARQVDFPLASSWWGP
ncbi:ATP-binding protein [Aeromonas sp. 74A]